MNRTQRESSTAAASLQTPPQDRAREKGMRLNVFVAAASGCSRREADRLIEEGRVCTDGRRGMPGDRVYADTAVTLDGDLLTRSSDRTVVAYYKPAGVTCTAADPHAERTLSDSFHYHKRLTYAGRLDRDSEGLLLMTDDGALIEAAMRGGRGHEKEYLVRTDRPVREEQLRRMSEGIYLKDLDRRTLPCSIQRTGDKSFRIVLTQGLNRQIRRMCRAVGLRVVRLQRVRVLNIALGAMRPGEYREITGDELRELYRQAGIGGSEGWAGTGGDRAQ